MKKFLTLICILTFSAPVFAITDKEFAKMTTLYEKVETTKSVDDFNKAADYYFKLYKKEKQMPSNPEIADQIVLLNYDRYNTTHIKRYKKYAEKYVDVAIKYNTQDINTLVYGMSLAGENLDTYKMIRYYDYLCKINPQAGESIKGTFSEHIANVNQQKAINSANKWAIINTMLNTYIQNRPRYTTTTGTVDVNGFVNLNSVTY